MYRVSETIRATHGCDGSVVLDIRKGRVIRLNVTASLIFQHLQKEEDIGQIIDAVSQEFLISHEIASTDVLDFLKAMTREGLVLTGPSLEPL